MKNLFFIISCLFSFGILQGQSTLGFTESTSQVKEKYKKSGFQTFIYKVKLNNAKANNQLIIHVVADPLSTAEDQKDYKIITPKIVIEKDDAIDSEYEIFVQIMNDKISKEENDETLILKITDPTKDRNFDLSAAETHTITIVDSNPADEYDSGQGFADDEFRIDIGTNFDLIENLSPEGIYANLYAFKGDLGKFKLTKDGKGRTFGIAAGIYQNRIFSDMEQDPITDSIGYINIGEQQDGTIGIEERNYTISRSLKTEHTGLYFNPMFLMNSNENVSWYIGLKLEVLRRTLITDFTYESQIQNTLFVEQAMVRDFADFDETVSSKQIEYERYISFNFPIMYRIKDINLLMVPIVGYVDSPTEDMSVYSGFRFNAIDFKSGVNLGGEIRGFFPFASPRLNIYVSKAFNIGPLARYRPDLIDE